MMEKNQNILVPCDYKEESTTALIHAAYLAEKKSRGIVLLHLLFPNEELPSAEATMRIWKEKLSKLFKGSIKTIVLAGDILSDIGPISQQEKCYLVVMPTHGMKGIQEVTGSLALNVITGAKIPFLIVQHSTTFHNGYKKMVVPIESRHQLIEEVQHIVQFAKINESEIIGYVHDHNEVEKDPEIVSEFERILSAEKIPFKIESCLKFDFSKATTEFAATINADIICAINYSYENLYSINPRTDEEDLIYNKTGIPVLLITPANQDDDLIQLDSE
jgi:nucleotide-binding universal stress UspA family protein